MADLRAIDLVALAEKAGAQLTQRNNEWRGACPLHGGKKKSSFVIYNTPEGQLYTCFTDCSETGTAIKFAMRTWGLDYKAALERLGLDDLPKCQSLQPRARPASPPPDDVWQRRARQLIESAQNTLWSNAGRRARQWLNERGLTNETIEYWQLGAIGQTHFDRLADWGLTHESTGKKAVWVPRGILIPCIDGGQVWYMKIRRPDVDRKEDFDMKTPNILGGQPALFGEFGLHKTAFMVEGEFDAILLYQEAGNIIGVGTMGAAGHMPHGHWITRLLSLERVYSAGDLDKAGEQHNKKWLEFTRRVKPAKILAGKDITDYWKAGGDLRAWVKFVIARDSGIIKPPPQLKPIIWPAGTPVELIGNSWKRLPDGTIKAIYSTVDALQETIYLLSMVNEARSLGGAVVSREKPKQIQLEGL